MPENLDLHDIQGDVFKAYGRFHFWGARYIFYHVSNGAKGRAFIKELLKLENSITNAVPWKVSDPPKPITKDEIPDVTTNIAFTYSGLKNLDIPRKSLQSFPEAFAMGMKDRCDILGDDGPSAPKHWDEIWREAKGGKSVDIWLSINGQSSEALEGRYKEICIILNREDIKDGVEQLKGHAGPNPEYQNAAALPTPGEHFGYADGISEAYFKGCGTNPVKVIGGGKPTRKAPDTIDGWEPLETGEFILGYRDESKEYPFSPIPKLLSQNGTYMVYRKLHENVASFDQYINEVGQDFPGGKEALAAKFVGRWRNGAPLVLFPTEKAANEFIEELKVAREKYYQAHQENLNARSTEALKAKYDELRQKLVGFKFEQDQDGARCPFGSHIRRTNPRGSLEFEKEAFDTPGALDNRRRLLRRGLPYGQTMEPDGTKSDDGDHGIIFMALCASIDRQFEFVQQQWINYGNDFKLSNDKDPILGNHDQTPDGKGLGRMVIEAPSDGNQPPFICANLKRFVETRGGDYFFLPSITAVRMISEGTIDPT
jgi:Dyp-type peroxidase family